MNYTAKNFVNKKAAKMRTENMGLSHRGFWVRLLPFLSATHRACSRIIVVWIGEVKVQNGMILGCTVSGIFWKVLTYIKNDS
jgi:hypothetical protein